MYNPTLMGLIFLSVTSSVNAMEDKKNNIQLRNTTPERKESQRRLLERRESLDRTPKVETGVLEGSASSTSPREKLRRDSATCIIKMVLPEQEIKDLDDSVSLETLKRESLNRIKEQKSKS